MYYKGWIPVWMEEGVVVVPTHKKNNKQSLKNYRPVSLLQAFGKMFERITCNNIFEYFSANNLNSLNQFGFGSCINQFLSITHEIYQSFDNGFEVWGVSLDISKEKKT